MPDQLLQFGGSLLSVVLLVWLVRRLELGCDRAIRDADDARRLAQEADHSFQPVDTALDRTGHAALLADDDGRIMLLRTHGTHHAARVLAAGAAAERRDGLLTVYPADRRFGKVALDLGEDAASWERRIGGAD